MGRGHRLGQKPSTWDERDLGENTVTPWTWHFMIHGDSQEGHGTLQFAGDVKWEGNLALPSSSCSRKGLLPALEVEPLEWSEWLEALGDVLGLLAPELSEYRPDESWSPVS